MQFRDGSGTISASELKTVFKTLDIHVTDHEIKMVLQQMDTDGVFFLKFFFFKLKKNGTYNKINNLNRRR